MYNGHMVNKNKTRTCGKGVLRGQTEEGRDQRGLSRLQQEDPSHCLAPTGTKSSFFYFFGKV